MIPLWAALIVLLSIGVGYLRGGNLSNLSNLKLKLVALLLTGLALRFFIWSDFFLNQPLAPKIGGYLFNLSNLLILSFLFANLKISGMKLILLGNFSNTLVILLNGGRIPFSVEGAKMVGFEKDILAIAKASWDPHIIPSQKTLLPFLGDVIPIPLPGIFANLISPGDIFILLGIFYLIQANMLPAPQPTSPPQKHVSAVPGTGEVDEQEK
jgi:hypothetical protein